MGEIQLGFGSWNTFTITSDSKFAYAADWNSDGNVYYLDLQNLTVKEKYSGSGLFTWPHGTALNATNNTLYVTAQNGNYIYKIDVTNPHNAVNFINQITLDGSPNIITSPNLFEDPHELAFSPDYVNYFVTCQHKNSFPVVYFR